MPGFGWVVSSTVRFSGNAAAFMRGIANATKAANEQILAQNRILARNAASWKEQASAARASATATRAANRANIGAGGRGGGGGGGGGIGGGFAGGGAAGALIGGAKRAAMAGGAFAIDSLYEAGKFEIILKSIQNITAATTPQMGKLRQQLFDVGDAAAMSAAQTGEMFREIARQSQGALSFDAMQKMLPYVAKMQVVLGATRGYSPETTTDAAMNFVHLMRIYDAKKMPAGFDLATRMFELSPVSPTQLVRQLTYFVPQLQNMHVPQEQMGALMLTMARAGYGQGKGGSGLAQLVLQSLGPLQMTSSAMAAKKQLLGPMGLNVLDTKGNSRYLHDKKSDVFGLLGALLDYEKRNGAVQAQKMFTSVYGANGGRIAALMSDPVIAAQLQNSMKAIKDQPSLGLNNQAASLIMTFPKAAQRAWENFQSLATDLGGYILPGATKGASDFAGMLHSVQVWLHANEGAAQSFGAKLTANVTLIGNAFNEHSKDIATAVKNFGFLASEMGPFATAAILAIGPLSRLTRVLTDLATGNVGDLRDLMKDTWNSAQDKSGHDRLTGDKYTPGSAPGTGPLPMFELHLHTTDQNPRMDIQRKSGPTSKAPLPLQRQLSGQGW